ncbi:hypothetical protein SteCoe_33793 [Stentor coeruleus]|uniref:Uncharacterized protein n=1 Tax=Stentor coeruleus TaxID=5963 RepID=A0A1R2AVY7_9CILI|nr:hypothetical protein SteCoe_33793 [Stentor coeruleus]
MSESTEYLKIPDKKFPGQEIEDQLDRLNIVIQDFMQNLDVSRSYCPSINISESIFKSSEVNSDTASEGLSENIERKFEEILQENDRLRMIIEDFNSNSERKVSEFGCTEEEIEYILFDLKDVLIGKNKESNFKIGQMNIKLRLISKPDHIFPEKHIISSLWTKELNSFEQENIEDIIYKLRKDNETIQKINKKITDEEDLLREMKSNFIIKCCDPIEEQFHSIEFPLSLIKEAALEIEVKKYKEKNKMLDQAQEEIQWQLNEVKSLKQTFLNKIQEAADYRKTLEKKYQELKDSACNNHKQTTYKKHIKNDIGCCDCKKIKQIDEINTNIIEDMDKSINSPFIPIATYKYFTIDELNNQLKHLEEKALTSSDPHKFLREIERCKTHITNLRGEQAILDCKQKTKNMFKIVKNIEKSVKSESSKRNNLIKRLIHDSNGDLDYDENVKKDIEESLDRSLKKLEEKRLVQKRSAVVFKRNFYEDQEDTIRELRTQLNILTKHDNIIKKSYEQKKIYLLSKEIELQEREKFLMDHWKKNYSTKDIVDTVQKISKKLTMQKEIFDKEKVRFENERMIYEKKMLGNEIEKGKMKIIAQQLDAERKMMNSEKKNIEIFLKQVSSLPSYLNSVKLQLPF